MKFRYFLRGVGAGIVFAAIIFIIAYNGKGNEIGDDEIIKRAKQLGMIEAGDQVGILLDEKTSDESSQIKQESNSKADEKKTESSEALKITEKTSEENNTTEEKQDSTEIEQFELVVSAGMSSYPVCQKLESFGLIDNAEEFDDYLIEHGYASKISVGTHVLKKGMTKEEIAIAISDK